MTLLDQIDNAIETYFRQNNKLPEFIVLNESTRKKVIALYKEDLNLDFVDNDITNKEDNYKGIHFKLDEKEAFIKCI